MDFTLLSFDKPNTIDCSNGIAPPAKPVPAPRVTTGVLLALQIFKICLICSTLSGKATAKGFCRYTLRPSHSNGRVFSSPVMTIPLGKARDNSWTIDMQAIIMAYLILLTTKRL